VGSVFSPISQLSISASTFLHRGVCVCVCVGPVLEVCICTHGPADSVRVQVENSPGEREGVCVCVYVCACGRDEGCILIFFTAPFFLSL